MKNNNYNQESNKGFYVALFSSIAVLAVIACGVAIFDGSTDSTPDIVASEGTDLNNPISPANQSDVKSYKTSETTTAKTAEATTTAPSKTVNSEGKTEVTTSVKAEGSTNTTPPATKKVADNEPVYSLFDDSKEMSWPVSGRIIMDYSIETAIYDNTLEQYRTNDNICIAAPVGTEVKSSAAGTVESISNDSVNGNSVVINHGNGWSSTYSQLADNVLVSEGEVVCESDVIGEVGEPSNYSVGLGPHVGFQVSKDNVSTDPKLLLAQLDE